MHPAALTEESTTPDERERWRRAFESELWRNVPAWRERKARERDEKEKAAQEAALLDKPD